MKSGLAFNPHDPAELPDRNIFLLSDGKHASPEEENNNKRNNYNQSLFIFHNPHLLQIRCPRFL